MTDREPDLLDVLDSERVIAFVIYPGLTPLDLVGPVQVLSQLGPPYRLCVVGEEVRPLETDTPIRIEPSHTFAEVPDPYAVFVPGGAAAALRAMADEAVQGYLRDAAGRARLIGSVCTGSLVLAAAGLLEGKRATTHWTCMGWLKKLGARPVQERWVEDGNCVTAAGISAGIDWALALTARLKGEEHARRVQILLEYDPDPPFGWIDWDNKADFDALGPLLEQAMGDPRAALAGRPDLIKKLGL
ncbi:MAG: DJ-1/PfpI family protein [Gammaproteobacteria bacterium]|nr:DJ-1/PfpI family protein [Gammaproteobacteria bacterium]